MTMVDPLTTNNHLNQNEEIASENQKCNTWQIPHENDTICNIKGSPM